MLNYFDGAPRNLVPTRLKMANVKKALQISNDKAYCTINYSQR